MKIAKPPLVLYSANTFLAYMIAENFYNGIHYVWCTPYFDPNSSPRIKYTVPPSSSPLEIYQGLLQDVIRKDHHSTKINDNKAGILRGAQYNLRAGMISNAQVKEIRETVERADITDFSPLIYVIPYNAVKNRVRKVPVNERAHPLSQEFRIFKLPNKYFDVVSLHLGP